MRFLCASNLHLGRRVAGLPEHAGLDPARLSAASAWIRLVNAAASHQVDAVLLAGDIIDRENPHLEPAGALLQGLGILHKAGIPVVAIAGDEDTDALPAVIDTLAAISRSGTITLLTTRAPSVALEGVTVIGLPPGAQPGDVASIPLPDDDRPVVVMAHASLTDGNAPEGTVQPFRSDHLSGAGVRAWVLGAQREPDIVVLDDTTVIEPGATLPMSPHETGMHGATLVELLEGGDVVCEMIPLAPVQFADIDLDLTGIDEMDAVESAIVGALQGELDDALATDSAASLAALVCTLHLSGATPLHAEIPGLVDDLMRTLAVHHQGVVTTLGHVEIDTRPEVDIRPLLGRPDPVGELARLLRTLDDDADEERPAAHEALVRRAADRLVAVHRSRVFAGVASDPAPDADDARTMLRREAWTMLDALVRQRGID